MHQPIPIQGKWLGQVVRGWYNCRGPACRPIAERSAPSGSSSSTSGRQTLRRRSQRDGMTWERITRMADDWLPKPKILHPWPSQRFAVRHPRWEPYARIGPVRICAGGAQQ